ncbi:MAG: outer membrane beta-barrel protein [bacterium]
MKKYLLLTIFIVPFINLSGQNSIGLRVGFLGTQTRVAEYSRPDQSDYLLDHVTLNKLAASLHVALSADLSLGNNFSLTTAFHYERKGLSSVSFIDSVNYIWEVSAYQHYVGLSMMIQYNLHFRDSKFGMIFATGPKIDFAVGTPNQGALYSGKYRKFFMPFSRFNEVDLSWGAEVGGTYRLGPGDFILRLSYLYGLSDVFEDAYIVGRSQSVGISIGYSIRLGEKR